MAQNDRVPMLHPTKKKDGKPVISYLNPNTVKSGKAEKMGYTKVPKAEKAPDFKKGGKE